MPDDLRHFFKNIYQSWRDISFEEMTCYAAVSWTVALFCFYVQEALEENWSQNSFEASKSLVFSSQSQTFCENGLGWQPIWCELATHLMRIGTHSIAMKINNLPQTIMCVLQIRRLKDDSGFKWWIIIVGVVSGVLVVGVILWLVVGSTFHKSHEDPINMAYQTHAAQNYGTDCYQGQQDPLIAANTQPAEWQHSDPYNRPHATGEYRPNPMNHLPYSPGVRPTPAYNRQRTDGVAQRASPMPSQHTSRDSSPPVNSRPPLWQHTVKAVNRHQHTVRSVRCRFRHLRRISSRLGPRRISHTTSSRKKAVS